ncbi:peptidoglycan/LPS O-acetylase OafA/YrhL [Chitinophaga sp. OAE865]
MAFGLSPILRKHIFYPKSSPMKKIAIVLAAAGLILAILAQYALTNDWMWFKVFHTMGFVGYILIISGLACFCLWLIHQFSRDEKNRIKRYYHRRHDEREVNTAQQ